MKKHRRAAAAAAVAAAATTAHCVLIWVLRRQFIHQVKVIYKGIVNWLNAAPIGLIGNYKAPS